MTLLQLANKLGRRYFPNEHEVSGYLDCLKDCKILKSSEVKLLLDYIFVEIHAKNYTEIDIRTAELKKKLAKIEFNLIKN